MASKPRDTYTAGIKAVNTTAWGESKALDFTRGYGKGGTQTFPAPPDKSQPQFREDQPLDKTFNSVSENSWLRGGSKGGEDKPFFDRSKTGKR